MESDNSLQSWIPRLLRFLTGRKQNLNERSEKTEKTSHAVTEEDTPQNQPDDQNHSIDQKLLNSEACSLSRRTESPGPDLLRESLRRSKSQFPGHTEVATANLSLAYSLSAVLQSLGDVIFSTSTPVEKLRGKEFPQKHQKGESSNLLLGNLHHWVAWNVLRFYMHKTIVLIFMAVKNKRDFSYIYKVHYEALRSY